MFKKEKKEIYFKEKEERKTILLIFSPSSSYF